MVPVLGGEGAGYHPGDRAQGGGREAFTSLGRWPSGPVRTRRSQGWVPSPEPCSGPAAAVGSVPSRCWGENSVIETWRTAQGTRHRRPLPALCHASVTVPARCSAQCLRRASSQACVPDHTRAVLSDRVPPSRRCRRLPWPLQPPLCSEGRSLCWGRRSRAPGFGAREARAHGAPTLPCGLRPGTGRAAAGTMSVAGCR